MAKIVTVTPLAVERDSRTYKQAASLARFGHRSIVLEGQTSQLARSTLPFELRSLNWASPVNPTGVASPNSAVKSLGVSARLWAWFKKTRLGEWLGWLYLNLYQYGWRTFWAIPPASLYYLHAFYQFWAVYLRSKIHGAPYIYDAHDFYSRIEESPQANLRQRYYLWLEAQCVERATAVVTVCQAVADLQQKTFGRRPTVIHNSHDARLDQPVSVGLRQHLKLTPDDFLLVVIGQAKKGQALFEMLQALAELPSHVHVALLGHGYQNFLAPYQDFLDRYHLSLRVHLVPPLKPAEVVPFIESADASLILYYAYSINYQAALPNGFFQSIAAGLPLLYPSELNELAHLAQRHDLGIPIQPRSPASIQRAVLTLLEESEELKRYRDNARQASHRLNWEQDEQILRVIIEAALPSSRKL